MKTTHRKMNNYRTRFVLVFIGLLFIGATGWMYKTGMGGYGGPFFLGVVLIFAGVFNRITDESK